MWLGQSCWGAVHVDDGPPYRTLAPGRWEAMGNAASPLLPTLRTHSAHAPHASPKGGAPTAVSASGGLCMRGGEGPGGSGAHPMRRPSRRQTKIPRLEEVNRVEGPAGLKFDDHAPFSKKVNGAVFEPDTCRAEKPQGWGGVPGGLRPRGGEGMVLPVLERERSAPDEAPLSKAENLVAKKRNRAASWRRRPWEVRGTGIPRGKRARRKGVRLRAGRRSRPPQDFCFRMKGGVWNSS